MTDLSHETLEATNKTFLQTAISTSIFAVIFSLWCIYLTQNVVDDVYIFYRYAENLATGQGLVFNPGERVEGVSSLLWTVLLALVSLAGGTLSLCAPLLSLIFAIAALFLSGRIYRRINPHASQTDSYLLMILIASHSSFAYWSYSGMEAALYTLLLLFTSYYYLRERSGGVLVKSSLIAGLALFARPETPFLCLAFALDIILPGVQKRSSKLLSSVTLVSLCLVTLLTVRYIYFGELLPNTYYAKSGLPLKLTVTNGGYYSFRFLSTFLFIPGLSEALEIVIPLALLALPLSLSLLQLQTRPLALLLCFIVGAVTLEGGDWMLEYRFLVPAIPFLYILFLSALTASVKSSGKLPSWIYGVIGILVVSNVARGIYQRTSPSGTLSSSRSLHTEYYSMAAYLKQTATSEDVVALMDIGLIGYETGLSVIDLSGLIDKEIARAKGGFATKRYDPALVLDRTPRFIFIHTGYLADDRLQNADRFSQEYTIIKKWPLHNEGDTMILYERK
jgi:hypothetical protein